MATTGKLRRKKNSELNQKMEIITHSLKKKKRNKCCATIKNCEQVRTERNILHVTRNQPNCRAALYVCFHTLNIRMCWTSPVFWKLVWPAPPGSQEGYVLVLAEQRDEVRSLVCQPHLLDWPSIRAAKALPEGWLIHAGNIRELSRPCCFAVAEWLLSVLHIFAGWDQASWKA